MQLAIPPDLRIYNRHIYMMKWYKVMVLQDGKRCVITCALLSITRLYEGWTYTVIAWAYQFVGMLPASMCYAGGPCGTLKCALLAAIATPNHSANFILYVLSLNHAFCTMRGLDWHLCFDAHTRRSGGRWSS